MGSATLRALGVASPWRVLVLGVGLGALPGWFASKAKAKVHAVDLDPVVLRAAQDFGQLPESLLGVESCVKDAQATQEPLRAYCCGGVEPLQWKSNGKPMETLTFSHLFMLFASFQLLA